MCNFRSLVPCVFTLIYQATVNSLLGGCHLSHYHNTHGCRISVLWWLGSTICLYDMTQWCSIGYRAIRNHVIRGLYCVSFNEILFEIQRFAFTKINLKLMSEKCCLNLYFVKTPLPDRAFGGGSRGARRVDSWWHVASKLEVILRKLLLFGLCKNNRTPELYMITLILMLHNQSLSWSGNKQATYTRGRFY